MVLYAAAVPKSMFRGQSGNLVWGVVSCAVLLPLTLLFARYDGRGSRSVGLGFGRGSIPRLSLGVLVGLSVYGLILLLVSVVAGPIRLTPAADVQLGPFLLTACTILILSCMEELGFRGYPLRTLVPALGMWPAQGLVAAAFGLCHLLFGWSWSSILTGVVPCGLLFGMAAAASGGLAMPIGVHAGLNAALWLVGETGTPGLWTTAVDDRAAARVAAVAKGVSVAVVLLAALAFFLRSRIKGRHLI
jgi:membrane protease YdiL (CAAX protease family)